MTREQHDALYREALEKYGFTEKNTSEASLLYILTFIGGKYYERFLNSDSRVGRLLINPSSLDELSSSHQRLGQLGFHLFTWRDEYVVPEVDFCNFDQNSFEVAIQAIRIRCRMQVK